MGIARHTPLLVAMLLVVAPAGLTTAATLDQAVAAYEAGDYAQARRLLEPMAEKGSVEAQFRVGTMLSLGQGVPEDHAHAALWFERAAAQGHHEAAVTLANMHLSGLGVARDETAAMRWFERAAEIAAQQEIDDEEC
jgi:hypothetical protein